MGPRAVSAVVTEVHGTRSYSLRPYQHAAVESLFAFLCEQPGNPVLSLPTAAGKSVVQAAFIRRILNEWPSERFVMLAHVKELLSQSAEKLAALLPGVSVGLFSAGLKRRELGYQVTVAGIQSVHRLAHQMGDVSFVIIDECHLVSKSGDTMYRRFLTDLRKFCPSVRLVGLTATPWRLDSGPLTKGEGRIFTDIAFHTGIRELVSQGFLAPLTTARTVTRADTSRVRKRGGEFITGELEAALNQDRITEPALDEVLTLASERRSWLVFCVGVKHAARVCDSLAARGVSSRVIDGETPSKERDRAMSEFRLGRMRALVSVGVLTTGVDLPNIDCIVVLRPTQSPGLWVQMLGRGLRLSPETGKSDCCVLDFTSNSRTHGPIDLIEIDSDGAPRTSPLTDCESCSAEIPRRERVCPVCGHTRGTPCPECAAPVPLGTGECVECGFVRPVLGERAPKHDTKAAGVAVLSDGTGQLTEPVAAWRFAVHKKLGKPDSLEVTYEIDRLTVYREFICFEHPGWPAQKAATWWVRRGGESPAPVTVAAALARQGELTIPDEIRVKRDGRYWKVA